MLSVLSNLQNTVSMNDIGGEEEVWHFWPKIQNFQIFCTFLHRSYFFPLRRAYDLFCLFAGSKVICYTHRCILLPNSNHRGKIDTDSLLNFQHFLLLSSTSPLGSLFLNQWREDPDHWGEIKSPLPSPFNYHPAY